MDLSAIRASEDRGGDHPRIEACGDSRAVCHAERGLSARTGGECAARACRYSSRINDRRNRPLAEKSAAPPTQAAAVEKIPNEDRDDGQNDVDEGEKYLYGRGVRQDCGRARSSLMTAADLSNARAQGMLGDHVRHRPLRSTRLVNRLSMVSEARQKDPNNVRIEQDLHLVWRQMTAEQQREVGSLRP